MKIFKRCDCFVDACRLPSEVSVDRTNNDSRMLWIFTMQSHEILAIESDDGPLFTNRPVQSIRIACRLTAMSMFLNRYDIMS